MERKYLWFYERLYGALPILATADPTEATIFILLIFEAFALLIGFSMGLSMYTILVGTLMVFMLALWTEVASYIAPNIRAVRMPKGDQEKKIMALYKRLLFSEESVELIMGIIIFVFLNFYFIRTGGKIFEAWLMGHSSWVVFLFGAFLVWEISYRIALSLWTSLLAAWRSVSLFRASKKPVAPFPGYLHYQDIEKLERLDRLNLSFALIGIPLFLVSSVDKYLWFIVILYLSTLLLLFFLSVISLRFVKLLPPRIDALLSSSMFSMLGIVEPKSLTPHLTTVAFTHDAFNVYILTSVVSKKLRVIKKNPNASLFVDERDENEAVLIRGEAQILDFLGAFKLGFKMFRIKKLFAKKYPQYAEAYAREQDKIPLAWQLRPFVSRLVIKIPMEEIIYWNGTKWISM